jgi:hypothetical protein
MLPRGTGYARKQCVDFARVVADLFGAHSHRLEHRTVEVRKRGLVVDAQVTAGEIASPPRPATRIGRFSWRCWLLSLIALP